jgi:hypothetical protein
MCTVCHQSIATIPRISNPIKARNLAAGSTVLARCQTGQKRLFGAAGMTNIVVSNAILHALLALNAAVSISTLITQVFNACMGYTTYDRNALSKPVNNPQAVAGYTAMAGSLWFENWGGIKALEQQSVPKTAGAPLDIPPLAIFSYLIMLRWVFQQQ